MKIKEVKKKILPLLLIPFFLTGCSPKSECKKEKSHVHKYIMNSVYGKVTNYIDSESLSYGNFIWTEDFVDITKDDEAFYRAKNDLFEGKTNWNYLYNFMANQHDYLEFYYHYTTEESYTDDDGDTHYETRHHRGWTTDPWHRGVTGELNLCHHRFYGYKIVYKNGKYVQEQSRLVDDVRDIMNEYPYFSKDCAKVVTKGYYLPTVRLDTLKPSDFNYFTGPDLTNKSPTKSSQK